MLYVQDVSLVQGVIFTVDSDESVRISLGTSMDGNDGSDNNTISIVLGSNRNFPSGEFSFGKTSYDDRRTYSWIASDNDVNVINSLAFVSLGTRHAYWISWSNDFLQVGFGTTIGFNPVPNFGTSYFGTVTRMHIAASVSEWNFCPLGNTTHIPILTTTTTTAATTTSSTSTSTTTTSTTLIPTTSEALTSSIPTTQITTSTSSRSALSTTATLRPTSNSEATTFAPTTTKLDSRIQSNSSNEVGVLVILFNLVALFVLTW